MLLTEGRRSEVEDLFMGGSAEVFPKVEWVSSGWVNGRVTYVQHRSSPLKLWGYYQIQHHHWLVR